MVRKVTLNNRILPIIDESQLKLERLYQEKKFTDFVIVCSGKEYPVHKWVLSDSCEYFRTMFESEWKETTLSHLTIPEGISEKTFESFLYFMYNNILPPQTEVEEEEDIVTEEDIIDDGYEEDEVDLPVTHIVNQNNESDVQEEVQNEVEEDISINKRYRDRYDIILSSFIANNYLANSEFIPYQGKTTFSDLSAAKEAASMLYPKCRGILQSVRYENVREYVLVTEGQLSRSVGYEGIWLLELGPKKFKIDSIILELYELADYFLCPSLHSFLLDQFEHSLSTDSLEMFKNWVLSHSEQGMDERLQKILVDFVADHHVALVSSQFQFHELGSLANDVIKKITLKK